MMEKEFTAEELMAIWLIHNTAYDAMCKLLGRTVRWEMNWIAPIAEVMAEQAVKHFGVKEEEIYPYRDS